ncbi:hypothetical protein EZS27_044329 [termite gut metagenome]|uniref:RseC/MucC family positive regulator of sigma(E) n=1 Tax=termite gut metagenome TaxID=433724 RepID=A0A5J4P4L1_9ZZZZ
MVDTIEHQGIVKNIDEAHIQVKIIQISACVSCTAKTFCSAADSKEKIIEIDRSNSDYKVGDKVIVTGKTSIGIMAVFIAFVIPFFILVVSLFVFMFVTHGNELLSASLSFLFLIPYYIILRIKRNYLKQKLLFTIKPII